MLRSLPGSQRALVMGFFSLGFAGVKKGQGVLGAGMFAPQVRAGSSPLVTRASRWVATQ